MRGAMQKASAGGGGGGTEGKSVPVFPLLFLLLLYLRQNKQLTMTSPRKSFLIIAHGRQFPGKKNGWCAEEMRVRMHSVWTHFFRQWCFGVCPVCHVHWLNPEYMLAIFDHHLPYWFVSKGTVIKKPLIYCPYLLMGFFFLINFSLFLSLLGIISSRQMLCFVKLKERASLWNKGVKFWLPSWPRSPCARTWGKNGMPGLCCWEVGVVSPPRLACLSHLWGHRKEAHCKHSLLELALLPMVTSSIIMVPDAVHMRGWVLFECNIYPAGLHLEHNAAEVPDAQVPFPISSLKTSFAIQLGRCLGGPPSPLLLQGTDWK